MFRQVSTVRPIDVSGTMRPVCRLFWALDEAFRQDAVHLSWREAILPVLQQYAIVLQLIKQGWSLCQSKSKRTGLSFTIPAGPRQRSQSDLRVPWNSRPHFNVPDWRPPNLEGHVPVFLSRANRAKAYVTSKSKLCYDRRSVGQSVLVSSIHLGPKTRFLLLSDSCGFVDVGRFPWREDASVVYNCCWPSPAQSRPYFTVSDSRLLQTGGPVPPYFLKRMFIWIFLFKNSVHTSQETLRLHCNDRPDIAAYRIIIV
jgi:hypothetical protein